MDKNDKDRTEQAWQRVYGRLSEDKLLTNMTVRQPYRFDRMIWVSIAASILLICAIGLWFVGHDMRDKRHINNMLTLQNSENSTLVTTLQDGSIVLLAQDASLTFPESFDAEQRSVNLMGNACFDIAKNAKAPFIIHTPSAIVKVLGTIFSIDDTQKGYFELTVKEGVVEVETLSGDQKIKVSAGQQLSIFNNKFMLHETTDTSMFDGYMGNFRFKDQKLIDIIQVIEQYGNGDEKIELLDTSIGEMCLTLEINDYTLQSFVTLLTQAFGLKSEKEGNSYKIMK